jgi:hypothetical protein
MKSYFRGQFFSYGLLQSLKKETKVKAKVLTPILIKLLEQNKNPMSFVGSKIKEQVVLQQKILCLVSEIYGMQSVETHKVINNSISNIMFRIFAVNKIFKSIRTEKLSFNLFAKDIPMFIKRINYNKLCRYKKSF